MQLLALSPLFLWSELHKGTDFWNKCVFYHYFLSLIFLHSSLPLVHESSQQTYHAFKLIKPLKGAEMMSHYRMPLFKSQENAKVLLKFSSPCQMHPNLRLCLLGLWRVRCKWEVSVVSAGALASMFQAPSKWFKVTAFLLQSLANRVPALWPQISNGLVDRLSFQAVKSERVLNFSSKATGLLVNSVKCGFKCSFCMVSPELGSVPVYCFCIFTGRLKATCAVHHTHKMTYPFHSLSSHFY